jgi:hypothetical protein
MMALSEPMLDLEGNGRGGSLFWMETLLSFMQLIILVVKNTDQHTTMIMHFPQTVPYNN